MRQNTPGVKVEQIEGLREFITRTLVEERDRLVPPTIMEDMERLRRSPAGAIIRLEEKVDRLDEQIGELRSAIEKTVTKEELAALTATTREGLARMATEERVAGLEKVMTDTLAGMATEERVIGLEKTMAAALAGMATEERVVGLEKTMAAALAGMEKRISLLQRVVLAMFSVFITLQVAILVKLFFLP